MTVFVCCWKAHLPVLFVQGELYWWEKVICWLMGKDVVYVRT